MGVVVVSILYLCVLYAIVLFIYIVCVLGTLMRLEILESRSFFRSRERNLLTSENRDLRAG